MSKSHKAAAIHSRHSGESLNPVTLRSAQRDAENEWVTCRLGDPDVATLVMGQSPPSSTYNSTGNGVPFFQGKADFGYINPSPRVWCSMPSRIAQRGDILMSIRAPVGDVNIAKDVCALGRGVAAIRPAIRTNGIFLFYALQFNKPRLVEASSGAIFESINKTALHGLELQLPPKPEQEKIAAILWKLQRAIAVQDRLIAATADLKAAAMQRLFTHGLRGEPLKDTAIGPIPSSWKIVKGAELFKLTSGSLRPKELSPKPTKQKPYPVLGGNGVMGYADKYLIDEPRTVVIGRVGEYCGASHLASGKVWITDNALFVKEWLLKDASAEFIAQYLAHYDLNRFKRRAGQPLVTQGTINELSFAIPDSVEQRDIANTLATLDRKLAHHRRKRSALDALFQTTLHKLMTGAIRVAGLDIDTSEVAVPTHHGGHA